MKVLIALSVLNLAATSTLLVGGIIAARQGKKKAAELEVKMSHIEKKAQTTFGRVKFALQALEED